MNTITLSEGAGGRASRELEESFIFPLLGGSGVNGNDASVLFSGRIAVSTDSFVVSPLFFPEKSIGALAAAGSINDVLTCGAAPRYLTCSLIIEEGFSKDSLKRILADLRSEADRAGVTVAAGDTKVVPRGQCDGLYINTACIGLLEREPLSPQNISPGDAIIVTGYLGEHESALIIGRNGLDVKGIVSDCAGLSGLILPFLEAFPRVKAMRDPTRGGIAATLNELALQSGCDLEILEAALPVSEEVRAFCGVTGLEVCNLANEGKMLVFVPEEHKNDALDMLRAHEQGKHAAVIGRAAERSPRPRVLLETDVARRILPMPSLEQVPRIC